MKIKNIFLATVLLMLCSSAVFADNPPSYDIQVTIDESQKTLSGQQTVRVTNTSDHPISDIYFHVYPNRRYTKKEQDFLLRFSAYFKVDFFPDGFKQTGMKVDHVRVDGQAADAFVEGDDLTLLRVSLDQPLSAGQSAEVSMNFSGELPHAFGRFGWHEDMIKLARWYPMLAVLGEEGWNKAPFYLFHRPFYSDAAHYKVKLTFPKENVLIHTGIEQQQTDHSNGMVTYTLISEKPVRDFTAALSPSYELVTAVHQGVTVKSYHLPGFEERAQQAADIAGSILWSYSQWFGDYPYKELSIAPVYLGYGGEQMSNLIFIDTRAYELPVMLDRYFEFLIAHEAGHQWIYNMIGINEFTEMWLEEGVNSYFVEQYLTEKYGPEAEVVQVPDNLKNYQWILPKLTFQKTRDFRYKLISRVGYDHPVASELSSFSEPSAIFSLTYGKGSRIIAMLRSLVGDGVFEKIFKRVFAEHKFENLSIKQFIQICEDESGLSLEEFFQQWLYTAEYLDLAVNGIKGHDLILENRGGIRMSADVRVHFRDGTQKNLTWTGRPGHIDRLAIGEDKPVAHVEVDPEHRLLDIDRTNNNFPRLVYARAVPFYFPMYDIPLFMEEDAYNLTVGPELNRGIGVKAALHKPFDQSFYVGSGYEFGEDLHHTRVGYRLNNVFHSQTAFGWEISNTNDYDDGNDDLTSGKVYLRRELWPVQYGLGAINDHATLYMIRNAKLTDGGDLQSKEDGRSLDYSRRNESIVGVGVTFDRSGPYPDPRQGYKVSLNLESAGHFIGATQYFQRARVDGTYYVPVTLRSKLALRVNGGWGGPDDKELFYLGGIDGLRGFKQKDIRGASAFMGSMEYRFPLLKDLDLHVLDNILGLDKIDGVVFFEAGRAWFGGSDDLNFRKDAGFGLRMKVDIGSFLEQVIVRADVAQAIDSKEDTRFWFGVGHAF